MTLPVSAFIICHNEAAVIERCLRSVAFCGEIVVVDSGSTDGTLDIIARLRDTDGLPIRLFHQDWLGFGAQKQFALDQCRLDWCLSIDSDERVSRRLAQALPDMIARQDVAGWRLTRYDYLPGYGYVPPSAHWFNNRLFRRGRGRFDPSDRVHEGIHIDGRIEKAPRGGLLHFRPVTLDTQMLKENRYSTLKAAMKAERGIPPKPWKMVFSPPLYFLRSYIGRGQWRCGWAGFIHSANGAVYSYLTEAKRWESERLKQVPPVEPEEPEGY